MHTDEVTVAIFQIHVAEINQNFMVELSLDACDMLVVEAAVA